MIGEQEFRQSENTYNYQVQKKKLTDRDPAPGLCYPPTSSIDQARQLYVGSQNALDLTRKKVGDLIVRAPVDGQLTSLDAELGQNKNKGETPGPDRCTQRFQGEGRYR